MATNYYLRSILERMMTAEQLKKFSQEYHEHKLKHGRGRKVTDRDLLILHDYKKGMLMAELMRKYHMSYKGINSALALAATSQL